MEIKREINYQKSVKCSDVYTESQTDYILPDYMSDMRKILFTDASLRPSGRFAGGETVEFSGIVVYNVIYLDAEGEMASVEFSSDYEYSVKCSGDSYNDSVANTRVSNYAIRLVGPRKISAKASLVGSVSLSENCLLQVSGDAFGGDSSPEVNTGSIDIRLSVLSSLSEREYAEQLCRLDGAIADEVLVMYPTAELIGEELRAEGDEVVLKGRLRMSCLVKNGDEPVSCVEKIIPYEESVTLAGAETMQGLVSKSALSSVKATVNADENGCAVVLSAIAEYCALGEGNQRVEPLLDGYLRDAETDNSYTDLHYTTLKSAASVRGSHSAELPLSQIEAEDVGEILFLTATPKVEQVDRRESELTLLGEVRYSGVASENDGDKKSFVPIRFCSPFEINVNVSCQNGENTQIEAEVSANNCTAGLDKEKLYATCTLDANVTVLEKKSLRTLSSMTRRESSETCSDDSVITVYYPTDGDTLFSVAKRFRTSGLKLAGDNGISELVFAGDNPAGSLSGVKKLVIF